MGTSRSFAELGGKLGQLSNELQSSMSVAALDRLASLAKKLLLAELARAVGADLRMSRVGPKGARLGVASDVKQGQTPTAMVRATGPWQLIEGDTDPHVILPRGVGRAKGRSKAARHAARQELYNALFGSGPGRQVTPLRTPFGPRNRVLHPGTKGKHPFANGVERAQSLTAITLRPVLRDGLQKTFR
jgi:hypothetical protein